MAKVKVNSASDSEAPATPETPSAQAVAAACAVHIIEDEKGRSIELKKPGVLAQFRLIEALGGETAKNEVYMGMVLPLIFVTKINGEAIYQPTSKLEVEALIQRLDDEGVAAVHAAVHARWGKPDPDAARAKVKN